MSILIKGMEMPTSCAFCRFCDGLADTQVGTCAFCMVDGKCRDARTNYACHLVHVPEHGRLIDETYLNMLIHTAKEIHANEKHDFCNAFDSNGQVCTEWWCVEDMIENAPTIIPADPVEVDNGT